MAKFLPLTGLKNQRYESDDSDEKGFVETPDGAVAAYQPPDQGPFRCDACEYYPNPYRCRKPEVIKELGKVPGEDLARVDPAGCCNFFSKQ